MEKQDILEKSRREKTDEGVTYAENAGRRYGMIAFCLLNSAVILYNLVKGLDSSAMILYNLVKGLDSYLPLALFWGYLAAEGLGKYQARRERKYLWVVVCGAIASLCFLLCYVLRTW